MTEQEYVDRWKERLVGGFCYGSCHQELPVKDRDRRIPTVIKEVEALLRRQYQELNPKPQQQPANGKPAQTQGATK